MNNLASNVATLSPQQRAVLELKLRARRQSVEPAPAEPKAMETAPVTIATRRIAS